MSQTINLDKIIRNIEPLLLAELKKDYNTLYFIKGFVYEELKLPEKLNLMNEAQKKLHFETTLDFLYHLLKNRRCKVFSLEYETEGNWIDFLNII